MKTTALLIAFCWCCQCFAQQKTLRDSANILIGPLYKVCDDGLDEVDLNKDGRKEIVVTAYHEYEQGVLVKIFVLARSNNKLIIIDSSTTLERDGRGPHVFVDGNRLIVEHAYNHEDNRLVYIFNKTKNRYILTSLMHLYVDIQKHGAEDHTVKVEQEYGVINQRLKLTANFAAYNNERTKTIYKARPAGLLLLLRKMKDPGAYYEVFISEGPLYKALTKQ